MRPYRIDLVIGTRPEAIKLAPVARALDAAGVAVRLIVTGQHPALNLADHALDHWPRRVLDCPGQRHPDDHVELLRETMAMVVNTHPPDMVMVQGDTSSAYGGALAAGDAGLALAHVEAGLRSHDPSQPWPEEGYRRAIDTLSDLLFAPTAGNAANLANERVMGEVHVTGNSGIDAVMDQARRLRLRPQGRWMRRLSRAPLRLLVTCHRRENWGDGIARLAEALIELTRRRLAVVSVMLHPNPIVSNALYQALGNRDGIRLITPLSYPAMLRALGAADLALSDSGGLQEEAPALGLPLLVLRDKTERPEAIATGSSLMTGTDPVTIVATVERLFRDRRALAQMARPMLPFGDGHASPRIAGLATAWLARRLTSPATASIGAAHARRSAVAPSSSG